MSKCEHKVVKNSASETKKLMHSLCPTDKANKNWKISKHNRLDLETLGSQPSPDIGCIQSRQVNKSKKKN